MKTLLWLHLVLGIDVRLVFKEVQCHRQRGDAGSQVQRCVPVDIHQVGICLMLQKDGHTAILLALHSLPRPTEHPTNTFKETHGVKIVLFFKVNALGEKQNEPSSFGLQ